MMDQKFCFASSLGFLLTMVSIVTVAVGMLDDRTCPHNGVNFRGRCFWFTDTRASWFEAGRLCNHLYGDHVTLVTVKDRETNEFIRSFSTRSLWIGLHAMQGRGKWHWVDNTELSDGNVSNWKPVDHHYSSFQSCAILFRKSEFWSGAICTNSLRYVCAELPSQALCPNGGVFFRDRCYWRGHGYLSWTVANQACQDEFGPETRLAVARDAETSLFLSRMARGYAWLGLSDRTEEGVWRWIDGAPLEYSNWFTTWYHSEPLNWKNYVDCAVIDSRAWWFGSACGDSGRQTTHSYICAIPPCFQSTEQTSGDLSFEGSGSGSGSVDHIICPANYCRQHCVNGGTCNATGQCTCIRQFSGMTCNLDDWKMEVDNEMVNISSGDNLTLKCMVNLPIDHILSFTWSKQEAGLLPQNRTNITNVLSQGYSILQISGVQMKDAGQYDCTAVLKFSPTSVCLPVTRIAVVDITEGTNTRDSFEKSVEILDDRTCPHNGVNFRGRCFWFSDTNASWFEAGRMCNHLYGDHVTLVTVKDRETNEFIRSFSTRSLWIGLHEMQGHKKWRWVDNTELSDVNFSNFKPDKDFYEPYESCAILIEKKKRWKDTTCTNRLRYVCAELPSPALCPNGGVFFQDRCYWRGYGHLSWADANQACQDEFGPETRLAVARDAETSLFLSRMAGTRAWLGLSYRTEEGLFRWIDDAPLGYSNWGNKGSFFPEPNNMNGDENCVVISERNKWYDEQCGDSGRAENYSYICAIPPC